MKTPEKGNYIYLEDVRVAYDNRTQSISITSKDPDLPPGGFNLTINSDRHEEKSLRKMLTDAGKMPLEVTPLLQLPDYVSYEQAWDEKSRRFPLGVANGGPQMDWNIDTHSNLLLRGAPGSGKSNIIYGLLRHCSKYKDDWKVLIPNYDMNYFEHGSAKGSFDVSDDIGSTYDLITKLYDEMANSKTEKGGLGFVNTLLIVDELAIFADSDLREDVLDKLNYIMRMGRSYNVYLVISTKFDAFLPLTFSENMLTVVTGEMRGKLLHKLLGPHAVLPPNHKHQGRGYINAFSYSGWVQFYDNY